MEGVAEKVLYTNRDSLQSKKTLREFVFMAGWKEKDAWQQIYYLTETGQKISLAELRDAAPETATKPQEDILARLRGRGVETFSQLLKAYPKIHNFALELPQSGKQLFYRVCREDE